MSVLADPTPWALIEWVLGAAWAVLVVLGEVLRRTFLGIYRTSKHLEAKVIALEVKAALVDHDLRAVRLNQASLENTTERRHRENQQDVAELKEFLTDELREVRRQGDSIGGRIDRLLERGEKSTLERRPPVR